MQQRADADVLLDLGFERQRQGRLEEALDAYREAIHIQPDHAGAHDNLGAALARQEKLDEAIAAYRKARDLASPNSELARLIERALVESGD